MAELVAGADSSTQSCKVVVCDAETGEVVRTGRAPHPDGTEVHPRHWWDAWRTATADGLLDGVAALSVGGQQHGLVCLDDSEEVVRDALLWNDTRSAEAARQLTEELGRQAWADRVGLVPVAATTVSKLRWLAEHEPDNADRTRTIVLPHDWLTGQILRDGGGFTGWHTDRGDASGTGYWSSATGEYDVELIRSAGGQRRFQVPTVLDPLAPAGRLDCGTGVAAGTGDNMGAALGLGIKPGEAVVSLGTSGTAFARHQAAVADPSGEVQSFADATGGHLPLMCTLNAARVLSAGAAMLGVDLAEFDRLALAAQPGAQGLTLLPFLDGERTPNLPMATGTLSGLTRANATPENLARACVEGMLLNVAAGVDSLRREGVAVERVLLIGGATGSRAVRELAADLFGVSVVLPASAEYVALGAAKQAAGLIAGEFPDWQVETAATVEPADHAALDEVRQRYAALLRTVHPG